MASLRPANEDHINSYNQSGPVKLGVLTSHYWRVDPKRLAFVLARYKFIAKMLSGCGDVLEVGCGDGFGAEIVLQEVGKVHGVDIEADFIANCQKERSRENLSFAVADLRQGPIRPKREAVYSIDVLEHIAKEDEGAFMNNIIGSLKDNGVCIIGLPSLESQAYASEWSRAEHVNCKSGPELKKMMQAYFDHVFLFSMNDEVVHTGFYPMAHYLISVAVGVKKGAGH